MIEILRKENPLRLRSLPLGKGEAWRGLLLIIILILTSCGSSVEPKSKSAWLLGTQCVVTWYEKGGEEAADKALALIGEYEQIISRNIEGSDVSVVNEAPGTWIPVHQATVDLVKKALHYAMESEGLFDPTIGEIVSLWDIGGDHPSVPEKEEIETLLKGVDFRNLALDDGPRLRLESGRLDLGGIAKGFIADHVRDLLKEEGLHTAIINLGGNILLLGSKPGGQPWKIGIQDPDSPRGNYLGILEVPSDLSFVTSGDYERYFVKDGVRYHHIIDPRTGYPAQTGLRSVTVVTPESCDGDALSTTLFLMGREKGMSYAETHDHVEAIFVTSGKDVYISSGLTRTFSLKSPDYTIQEGE